jgi:hypothetical protein
MTSNPARAAVLMRALYAAVGGDRRTICDTCTEDVRAWTPASSTASLSALMAQFERRDDAFSDIELEVAPLDVGGEYACVEWTVTMTHTGPLAISDATILEPTGLRVSVSGVTVAGFRADRICWLRQYWDELPLFDRLGALHEGGDPSQHHSQREQRTASRASRRRDLNSS